MINIFNFTLILALPFVFFIRIIVQFFLFITKSKPISVWSGAPIICMAKNCKAERLIGFNSFTVVRSTYFITNDFDFVISDLANRKKIREAILVIISFFIVCVFTKQVHAYVDGGLLPSNERRSFNKFELIYYKFLKVKLFVWTYGADVRTRSSTLALGQPNCCSDCREVGFACVCDDELWKKNFADVRKAATGIFSMGDMQEYVPGSRNDLFFWPVDLQADGGNRYTPAIQVSPPESALRVVHAPNHRQFKGTAYLEKAVHQLQAEGLSIDLVMVEGIPNSRALEIYRSADVIFDQCVIGFHGYFALEAMALGKPVMCFIRDPERYLFAPNQCPLINTNIDTLCDDLRSLAKNKANLTDIGMRGRQYVEDYFSLEAFSLRLQSAYRDLGAI